MARTMYCYIVTRYIAARLPAVCDESPGHTWKVPGVVQKFGFGRYILGVCFQVLSDVPASSVEALIRDQRRLWRCRPQHVPISVLDLPEAYVVEWLKSFELNCIDLRQRAMPLYSTLTLLAVLPTQPKTSSLHLRCGGAAISVDTPPASHLVEDVCILRALKRESAHLQNLQVLGLHTLTLHKCTVSVLRGLFYSCRDRLTGLALGLLVPSKDALAEVRAGLFSAIAQLRCLKVLAMPQWLAVVGSDCACVAPLRGLGALTVHVCIKLSDRHFAAVAMHAPALKFKQVPASRFSCN